MTAATERGSKLLLDALAEELIIASNMLGELAYDLGGDPNILRKHMTSLQKIDHVTQIQLAIADLLRKRVDDVEAVSQITLAEMADRLIHAIASEHQQ